MDDFKRDTIHNWLEELERQHNSALETKDSGAAVKALDFMHQLKLKESELKILYSKLRETYEADQ